MSMYGWDLAVVPGPPKADLQFRVLEEWLTNPFLDDDVTALHVHDPGPLRPVALPIETLKRTARLEHRVEVTDEQQPRPASVSAGGEVTRTIP